MMQMNNRRLYQKLREIEQKLDAERQTNKGTVILSFALAILAIAISYFNSGDRFMGSVFTLFTTFLFAYLITQRVKSLKNAMCVCLILAFYGIIIFKFAPVDSALYLVGFIIYCIGVLIVAVLYGLMFSKPSWFSSRHDNSHESLRR
jgi:hypothetical protein